MEQFTDPALDEICHMEHEAAALAGPGTLETKGAIDSRQTAWSRFREVNDRREAEIASRGVADPLLDEELRRLNDEMDGHGLETKGNAAPDNKAMRGPAYGRPGDREKAAIVAIGREVLEISRKVDAMKRAAPGSLREQFTRKMAAYAASRGSAADLADIRRRLSGLEVKRNRPPGLGAHMGPASRRGGIAGYLRRPAVVQFRRAVDAYLRKGQEVFNGVHLSELEKKVMHTELNPDGGYLMLPEHERSPLATFLREISPMRRRAEVRAITSDELLRPLRTAPADGDWRAERAPVTETNAPKLGEDKYSVHELWAMPAITQKLLDDAMLDVEAWLAGEVAETFAVKESDAWFNGNGVTMPRGLLTYTFVTPANWAHGSFRYLFTGVSGGFAASNPGDKLVEMLPQVKSIYRAGASWLMNRFTIGEVRKFKDSTGQYLWQPSQQLGQPDRLLGHPMDEDEYMPSIGADTFAVGFGDWKRTYLIVDRLGLRVLRDPYSVKGQVSFYTTKRTGGSVQFFDAAVFLKFGTS